MLVECVPNFSEGRQLAIIAEIETAIKSVPDAHLLDRHSDPDHNRTVLTIAGALDAIEEAAFRAIATAARLIDMEQQRGAHPRIGAADVVPFIPLRGISLAACAQAAQRLAQRVGSELNLPVYLYEAAAQRPERRNLADVRRFQYEELRQRIHDADRQPDYGPTQIGSAGAVAIGARLPLIAFNVMLDTADVTIAQQIARQIRASGGGLPALKALGFLVDGHAQISMNLTDFRQTSPFEVMERIRAALIPFGAQIISSELVGLIPQAALIDTALAYLQLPSTAANAILEQRIGALIDDYRELPFN